MESFDVVRGSAVPLPAGSLVRLISGELLLHVVGRPIDVVRAPAWLDVVGAQSGIARATYVAVTDARLESQRVDAVPPATWNAALREESERHWDRLAIDARREDDMFLAGAVPIPGPWWFRTAQAYAFVVQGDAAKLRAMLPPSVHPMPGTEGRYLVAVTRFEDVGSLDPRDTGRFAYHEVTPFIPAFSLRTGPVAFVPELYPDAFMAIVLGREIHGFPKRLARIGFRDDGAELIVDRALAMRARLPRRRTVDRFEAIGAIASAMSGQAQVGRFAQSAARAVDGRITPGFSALVRKRICDPATSGATFSTDSLVRVPFQMDEIRSAAVLEDVELEFAAGHDVLHGRAVAAFAMTTGLRFGAGHPVRDLR